MSKKEKIFVAGHSGMIGSAIINKYKNNRKFDILFESKKKLDFYFLFPVGPNSRFLKP